MTNSPWEQLAAGERWRGWWPLPDPDLLPLPVLAARGALDGPTILLTGGVHGDEYEGPAAIHHLFGTLDPQQLRGRVIGLPVVNLAAYRARSRTTPSDGSDLNRTFPGSADPHASHSDRLAHAVFTTFVQSCDLLVDLHSGGAKLIHLPMIGWYAGDTQAEQLARTFHPALHPWLIPDRAGVLSCEARRAGKVAVGAEWGGGARLDNEGVAAYRAGIASLLATFGNSRRPVSELDARPPIAGTYQEVTHGGLFVAAVDLGERVQAGAFLGQLYDELGSEVAVVHAEQAGLVAALAHNALLDPGDRVAYLG